jgi:hypothetical protein
MQMQGGKIDTNAGKTFGKNFWVSVSYDPQAVSHVVNNSLLKLSVINSYQKPGAIGTIPGFPPPAITVKPTYFVGHKSDSLIRIPAWSGPPSTPQAYGPFQWNSYVYADVSNSQPAGKTLVPVTNSKPTAAQIAAATCNVSDFINFRLDTKMAKYFNEQQSVVQGDTARAGDVALLVAMHVTTKEINNWTWQTFYWTASPANPNSPSSNLAASLRPAQLQGAASHYAVSTAYAEVLPNQPISGGTNSGVTAMIGYNPYLEAGFGTPVFAFPNSFNSAYTFGVQTNCMSCHALVTADGSLGYGTDQYVDMNNPAFINKVQLDFAWSLQQAIIVDTAKAK